MNKNFGKKKENKNLERQGFVFRILPNADQTALIEKTFGCVRFVWNKMLTDKSQAWKQGKINLDPLPAQYKDEFYWLNDIDSMALCNAQIDLKRAFSAFFAKKAKYPKLKSRKRSRPAYKTNQINGNIRLTTDGLKLPKFTKPIKIVLHRPLPEDGKIKSVTVSRNPANEYYASILVECPKPNLVEQEAQHNPTHLGLDYKMDGLYMDSEGNLADMPKYYRLSEKKLVKAQSRLSKALHRYKKIKKDEIKWLESLGEHEQAEKLKKPGVSKNYLKKKAKVGKISNHAANQRKDFLHKKSKELTDKYDVISVEDINLRGMARRVKKKDRKTTKGRWGKSVHDNGFGMFRNFLAYKQEKKGHAFIKVDKFFPSSRLCSHCGYQNPITKDLDARVIACPVCGSVYDRDINAARNIDLEGLRIYFAKLGPERSEVKPGDIPSDMRSPLQRSRFPMQGWANQEAPASTQLCCVSGG